MEKETNKNLIAGSGAENSRSNGDAHLSDEQIIAYQYGTFSSTETERQAQNHLIECRRCTNLLLELSDFAEETNVSVLSADDTDVQWARFEKKRLAESQPAAQLKFDSKTRRNFFSFLSFRFAAAAFGVLTIFASAAIFLALRNSQTNESSIARQTQPNIQIESIAPQKTPADAGEKTTTAANTNSGRNSKSRIFNRADPNPPSSSSLQSKTENKLKNTFNRPPATAPKQNKTPAISDQLAQNTTDFSLYPTEVLRGASADDLRKILVKQKAGGQIRLKLNAPKAGKNFGFSIVVSDSRNAEVLTLPILPDRRGDFNLIIPAEKLPAGVYSLKIYTQEKNVRRLFTEYNFQLEYE